MRRRRKPKNETFISFVDQYIQKHGIIKREKLLEYWKQTHTDEYNRFRNNYPGVNAKEADVLLWVLKLHGIIRDITDEVKIDDNGNKKRIRRYAHVKSKDGYAFQYKLHTYDDVKKASEANSEKLKNATACLNHAKADAEAVKHQAIKIKQDAEYRVWDSQNPTLFGSVDGQNY
ncbi:hypothetical protein [Mitsuokella sp.]|uniref:hypothetical protein n=1 Tax=Mitsuokella sp. TaxID=2049034 RepID=UPI003D7C52C6